MDNEARRKKHQELMAELLERKIRLHARQLYEQRGKVEGHALQDWVQAESAVLGNSILRPLYHRLRTDLRNSPETTAEVAAPDPSGCETSA